MNTIRHGLAVLFALLLIPGCSPKDDSGDTSGGAGKVDVTSVTDRGSAEERNADLEKEWDSFYETKYETGGTLVIGAIGDVDSLNPLVSTTRGASDVTGLLFMQLTRTNSDFSHAPMLATSWKFSDDRKKLTFKLRDDVYWTDGVKTTAHDVKFSNEMMQNEEIAWSAIKWKEYIQEVVVEDDHTATFVFSKVYPYQLMDAVVGEIVPKHLLEKVPPGEWKSHVFGTNPIGNGPYTLKEWKRQQSIEIVANEKYWRGRPPLDRIIWRVIPDQDTLRLQLKNGEVDLVESVPPEFHKDLNKHDHLVAYTYPSRAYGYVGWNMKNSLFQSRKVRTALTHAIDRQDIINSVLYGKGDVCKGPVSPIIWAYNPNLPDYPYDPERAKALLAEEGWKDTNGDGILDKDGKPFEFTIKTNKGNKIREDIAVVLQDQLKKVGIKMNINLLEWTIFSGDLNKKQFEAAIAGWSVGLKMDMTTLWHSSSVNDKFNFVSYSNPEFDKINDVAKFEMDREKARKLWYEAQKLIVEEQPYTFLYVPHTTTYAHKRFKNVKMRTVSFAYNVDQWWVPKKDRKY